MSVVLSLVGEVLTLVRVQEVDGQAAVVYQALVGIGHIQRFGKLKTADSVDFLLLQRSGRHS